MIFRELSVASNPTLETSTLRQETGLIMCNVSSKTSETRNWQFVACSAGARHTVCFWTHAQDCGFLPSDPTPLPGCLSSTGYAQPWELSSLFLLFSVLTRTLWLPPCGALNLLTRLSSSRPSFLHSGNVWLHLVSVCIILLGRTCLSVHSNYLRVVRRAQENREALSLGSCSSSGMFGGDDSGGHSACPPFPAPLHLWLCIQVGNDFIHLWLSQWALEPLDLLLHVPFLSSYIIHYPVKC